MRLRRRDVQADVEALLRRVGEGEGVVPAERRRAVLAGEKVDGAIGAYLERVRNDAVQVTDEEVAALRAAGHTDDEIFELTVAASVGASMRRLEAGLAAIAAVYGEE